MHTAASNAYKAGAAPMFELASTPSDLGEILVQGFRLGLQAFRRLFMLTSLIAFLGIVPTAYLVWGAGDVPITWTYMLEHSRGGYGLAGVLVLLASLFLRAVLLNRIAAATRGQTSALGVELRKAAHVWLWLFLAIIVYALAVFLGMVLLLVPGIILAVSLSFWDFGVVLEGLGPINALNASHNLVWGHWWRTLGMFLLIFLPLSVLVAIVAALVGLDIGSVSDTAATGRTVFGQTVLEMVFAAVFGPFIYSIIYIYYHDLKLRKQNP
jgi:hypothetical protein